MRGVVIVGGGQAGHQLAVSLREGGFNRPVTIAETERQLPYQRPPLSKDFLFANDVVGDVSFVEPGYYSRLGIEFRSDSPVVRIDRVGHEAVLASGERLGYEHLVLATGARARSLDLPGSQLRGVHTLRSLDDAELLRGRLANVGAVVVVGAGFIGLEFASGAAKLGHRVTVLESGSRILRRSLSAETAEFLSEQHAACGVDIQTHASVVELIGRGGAVDGVRLASGQVLPAAFVVVGIGVEANDELAVDAGLAVDGGIVVDDFLRTSDPAIYAIGDVARFANDFATGRVRVESVQNAADQARCVARALNGDPEPYRELPWFWTQQAGRLIQIAGISTGYTSAVMRRSDDPMKLSTFCYRDDRLIAVESVDQTRIHMQARRLLRAGISVPADRVLDPQLDLVRELDAQNAVTAAPVTIGVER